MEETYSNLLPNYQTKNIIVFNILKEKILSGELKPGEKLIIRELSSSLAVSETPIREALKTLEAEGLLSLTPHVGFIVTKLKLKELEDILIIRYNLEFLATEIAVDKISNKDIERLVDRIKEMRICIRENDIPNYGRLNREFHQIIYKASNNQSLFKLIIDLWDKSERVRSVFLLEPEIIEQSYNEHIQLIDILKKKDKNLAVTIMKKHKKWAFSALLRYFNNNNSI